MRFSALWNSFSAFPGGVEIVLESAFAGCPAKLQRWDSDRYGSLQCKEKMFLVTKSFGSKFTDDEKFALATKAKTPKNPVRLELEIAVTLSKGFHCIGFILCVKL